MAPRSSLSHCLSLLSEVVPDDAATLVKDLPLQTILQSLSATGSASIRRRKLPAEQVVWLVLGMALFRHLPIVQIVDQLGLALPEGPPVAPSAIHKARQRLGVLPMLWLFEATAQRWAHDSAKAHRFLGLGVYGIDGTTLRVADSQESRDHFGGTHTHRGPSGYPLVRLVALMALRSHLLAAAAFGPYDTHELVYAQSLFAQIPDESLVILDRGFFSAAVFFALCSSGNKRHFLCRVRKDFKARTVRKLGAGDELCELVVSSEARRKHPELPETLLARRIVYQRKGFRPQALLTSLLDPKEYPQKQLAELYHDRWELELGFDEVKTEMLARQETPFSSDGKKLRPHQYWWNKVHKFCRAAGVPAVCPHSLRGLHATLAIEEGAASDAVARALGHTSFEMTAKHYASIDSVANARLAKVAESLAPTPLPNLSERLDNLLAQLSPQECAELYRRLME